MGKSKSYRPTLAFCMSLFCVFIFSSAVFGQQQYLENFERRMTEFTLDNGLKFLVLERHEAPVVSFHTYADVGAVDEVKGITGLAHIFEHMAFKGTKTIGSKDYRTEAQVIAKVDKLFEELKVEQRKGKNADPNLLQQLRTDFKEAQDEASKFIVHDEFEEILSRQGASGLNAYTGCDATRYISSFPSNKLELWMAIESDRYANPVLREFYKEKDVVMEERRLRTESSPRGRLFEEFLALAFKAHPYGEPVIGHMSDIQTVTRTESEEFFKQHYSPGNLTVAIVGDVDPEKVKKLAQKYFSSIPSGPKPDPVETVEPSQLGERRVVLHDVAQPMLLIGFHKPEFNHPDNAAFDVLTDIISAGRTARLYKTLVKEKKIAVTAAAFHGFPGNKYPNLFLFYAIPTKGQTNTKCEQAIYDELEKLKNKPVSAEELKKARTRARAGLIRSLASNSGLAAQLAFYQVITGDWRNLFKELEAIDNVTAEDIQQITKHYFTVENRTVGLIETVSAEN